MLLSCEWSDKAAVFWLKLKMVFWGKCNEICEGGMYDVISAREL